MVNVRECYVWIFLIGIYCFLSSHSIVLCFYITSRGQEMGNIRLTYFARCTCNLWRELNIDHICAQALCPCVTTRVLCRCAGGSVYGVSIYLGVE